MATVPDWGKLLDASLLALLDACDEGIVVVDQADVCRMVGRRAGELFGAAPASLVGAPRADVLRTLAGSCEEPEAFAEAVGRGAIDAPAWVVGEFEIRRPRPRTVAVSSIPVTGDAGALARLYLVRDVTRERSAERARHALQARLDSLIPVDPLTQLPNQRRVTEELEREHARAQRSWDAYAVVLVDVDGMGALNSAYGNPVGDRVLETIADVLRQGRREYDLVGRWEGDAFFVVLPGTDAVGAQTVAERLSETIRTKRFKIADGLHVTASVGGAVYLPPSGETHSDMVRRATEALDTARASGPGGVSVDVPPPPKSSKAP